MVRSDNKCGRIYVTRKSPGLVLIQQQPSNGKVGKLATGKLLNTAIWSDKNQPRDRAGACEIDSNSAAQAPSDNFHIRVFQMNFIKQSQAILEESALGRLARAPTIPTIIE